MRELVRKVLRRSKSPQSSALQPTEDVAQTRRSVAGAARHSSSQQISCPAQPSSDADENVLRNAAPHVKAVLRGSAAPSWAEKRACANSNLQVLGTGFDIAGRGLADPTSFIEAYRTACAMFDRNA